MEIELIRIAIAEFLRTPIFINSFIHLDLWSIVHLFIGMFIISILSLFQKGLKKLWTLLLLLGFWEGFEYVMYSFLKSPYFKPETLIDVIPDLWVGLLGGIIG